MSADVRELTRADEVRALEPLVLEYFHVVTGALADLGVTVDPAEPVANMMANLDRFVPPAGRAYVAELDERLVGMAFLKPLNGEEMELKRLYVRPETRGTGLGRRLLRHTEKAARELGTTTLLLDTIRPLKPAISLYEVEGYRFIDAYPGSEISGYEQVLPHAVFMAKTL
ncbi:MAG: GNAT family N-acetyltransferase [Paracoccaceae bacterium]|nr:GNAT family N-acetyltransferase [Paracoccaceae bacterium]